MSWEVRTMKSATSCSNWFYPALWKKNMMRFWPIWAVYLACWIFAMPLLLLTDMRGDSLGPFSQPGQYFAAQVVREWCTWPALLAAVVFGILSAMAVFSYLYQGKSAGMLHALPVRREGLFLTNYLSGLSFMVLPCALVFVLTLLCELAVGFVDLKALCVWLLSQVLCTLFFYSFAVFCAMFTGHILALPVFYGILNGLAMGLYYLIYQVLSSFVFGFSEIRTLSDIALWLTPAGRLGSELRVDVEWTADGMVESIRFLGMGYLLLYAAVGLILAGLALAIYRRRKLEGAGDVVTVGWVRPIFKYGVAFCTALALGSLLYNFFGLGGSGGAWVLLVFMLLCGVVGYFVAEMLLKKSFKVFGKSWKGLAVFSLCLIAATAALELDLFGYEHRVPDPNQVVEVLLSGPDSAPGDDASRYYTDTKDPEVIRAVTDLHAAIVANKAEYERESCWSNTQPIDTAAGLHLPYVVTQTTQHIYVNYTLLSGSTVIRKYDIPVFADDLDDPATPTGMLNALVNRPQDKEGIYFSQVRDGMRLMDVAIDNVIEEEGGYSSEITSLDAGERESLLAAVKADMAAGRLGVRYLMDTVERLENCYYNDMEFTFRMDYPPKDWEGNTTVTVRVTLQQSATETMAELERLGVLDEIRLVTRAEMQNSNWERDQASAVRETVTAELA